MNVLVIAAHPDDEVLGVGGTVAWHSDRGDRVKVAVMCEGISARFSAEGRYELRIDNGDPVDVLTAAQARATNSHENDNDLAVSSNAGVQPPWYVPARFGEINLQIQQANRLLGVTDVHIGKLPDQRLEQLPISGITKEVEQLISEFEPEVVYTHFAGDINRDHRVLAEAVLVATRPYAAPSIREILMFETPSSTEWGSPHLAPTFHPNLYVDISQFLKQKIAAFTCYSGEVRPFPHPRSPRALADRAHFWGSLVNRQGAEPFVVVRSTR
jgi:N-acetylglucosamine malate deacetylase 1